MGIRGRLSVVRRPPARRVGLSGPLGVLGVALAAAAALSGCARREDTPRKTVAPSQSQRPDTLAPGDMAEGPVDVRGLRTPLESRVIERLGTITVVRSALAPSALEKFVAARVEGDVGWKDGMRVWKSARVKAAKDPEQRVQLTILRSKDPDWKSELLVDVLAKDTLPKTATQEDRLKAVGVSPSGKLLNPNRE